MTVAALERPLGKLQARSADLGQGPLLAKVVAGPGAASTTVLWLGSDDTARPLGMVRVIATACGSNDPNLAMPNLEAVIDALIESVGGPERLKALPPEPSEQRPELRSMTDRGLAIAAMRWRADELAVGARLPVPRALLGPD